MAKRRFRSSSEGEKAPEDLTPEERKNQRRRERAQSRVGKARRGFGSPLRRGLLLGIPAAVITGVVLFLLFNPFNIPSPCLSLTQPTASPAFPPPGTTDFSGSWCPQGATDVLVVEGLLEININGTVVTPSAGFGVNQSFPRYTCTLPVSRPPSSEGPLPGGADFVVASPWDFSYNLSWLFQAWAASDPTVGVGSAHPSQAVGYTPTDLMGFTSDATHRITLFVDNQPSNAGPSLVLPTLPYVSSPAPSPACVASVYHTGHIILLSYSGGTPTTATSGIRGATASTGPGDPFWAPQSWNGPMPRMTLDVQALLGASTDGNVRMTFALWRPFPLALP